MVYIKLQRQLWITLGLSNYIKSNQFILFQQNYYISYKIFTTQSTDQPLHASIKRQNIITNLEMKRVKRKTEQSPQERKIMQQIKARQQMRKLNKYNKNQSSYYFQDRSPENIKDLSKSISFAMTFIFSFFMAGLTGYYFGVFFMGLNFSKSLMVSMLFIIVTIIIETTLYIIKQNRQDGKKRRSGQKYQKPHKFQKQSYQMKKGKKIKTD